MARKRMHASRGPSPEAGDDFTRIDGIEPITMKRLHSAGIRRFAQLADLSAEDIASLLPNLSAKQVTRQSWIRQARERASSKVRTKTRESEPAIPVSRQHYENFTVEFLLGEKNKVRRLQIVHIQSGDVDTWTKWDAERLMDFLAHHTGTRLPYPKPVVPATVKPKPRRKPAMAAGQDSEVLTGTASIPAAVNSEEKIDATRSGKTPEHVPGSVVPVTTISSIQLREWKTVRSGTQEILHNLPHDQCFDVKLTLDLTNASLPDTGLLDVMMSLFARKLGDGIRQMIGERRSTIPYASTVNLTIEHATLPQGLYRLEACLTFVQTDSSRLTNSDVKASFQGGLFQVY